MLLGRRAEKGAVLAMRRRGAASGSAVRARGGANEARAFRCFCVPPGYVALLDLLVQPLGVRTVYPRVYLSASHEMFGITLIVTWVLTLIWFPKRLMIVLNCARSCFCGSVMMPSPS